MNRTRIPLSLLFSTLLLASCAHMPQLFWSENSGSGSSQVDASGDATAPSRPPLIVPPDLRGQVSVPMPDKVASDESPAMKDAQSKEKAEVAGTAVALDARVYDQDVATLFSAVVDAMTALNMPVQSVDSPSGTITTDWVRKDANSANVFSPVMSMFGAGPTYERYRFVVRVLRLNTPEGVKSELEVRALGQSFENSHWVNKPIKEKVSNDLFSAVGDQLARKAQAPAASASKAPAASSPAP
jgi:uncharacterized lipoprotein